MINIAFDAVTAGSLHNTKDPETGDKINEKDIIRLEWMLDIGRLHGGIESDYRKELPGKLIMQGCYGESCKEGIPQIGESSLRAWIALRERLELGKPVRVWYGESARDLCGLFHVCTLLQNYSSDVFAMYAPKVAKGDTCRHLLNTWDLFDQNSIGEYFDLQRLMDKNEIRLYADYWEGLVEDDAPLRASIAGVPVSVGEDFYDRFIEHNIPNEPIKESVLIGNIMGKYDIAFNYSWLVLRVQNMINNGMLKVIKDSDEKVALRIIQKVKV